MADDKIFTYQDVAEHNTKNDMFVVIHDKVYDCTKFLDEHPGGEEVMLDVAGQDSTEAFEDVGHSDEAREVLEKLYVGDLKRQAGDPNPKNASAPINSPGKNEGGGLSLGTYSIVVLGGFAAYLAYNYLQQQAAAQQA
ncbi:cytochrome b5-like heme/steroid binding domain-containing protein [Mariannaea sp. PMI_226]|nr:cytochrome b5-like heme/steroid binding domain-containing protein [Mariannaea sp. PMI_226]